MQAIRRRTTIATPGVTAVMSLSIGRMRRVISNEVNSGFRRAITWQSLCV
jgi:hypothetical protein